MTTIDARHVATVQRYITAYNSFDIPGMLATLAPEVEFRNVSDGTVTVATHGIEEFERQAISGPSLFQSRQQKIAALSFTADRVVVDISYRAKLRSICQTVLRPESLSRSRESPFSNSRAS